MELKSISSLHIVFVQNAEYFHLNSIVLKSLNDTLVAKYNLTAFVKPLKDGHRQYEILYLADKRSMIVAEAKEKDVERDNLFIAFKAKVSFCRRIGSPAEIEAATMLDFIVSTYKSANNKDYLTNTSMLTAFLRDAKDEKFAPHIETLGLTEVVNRIELANNEFDTLYGQRNEEKLSKEQGGNLRKLRRTAMEPAYRTLVTVINALYIAAVIQENNEATKELGIIIDKINTAVNDLSGRISSRRGGKKSSQEVKGS